MEIRARQAILKSRAGTPSDRRRKRPKFLTSRQSSHRYSTSSVNTDTTSSDAHIGVDYALQSGGAVPANNDLRPHGDRKQTRELSRSTSLGSMASGISGFSDENPLERRGFSGISEPNLHTLDEEDAASQSRPTSSGKTAEADDDAVPTTPKAKAIDQPLPTDTVIAQHVQDIQVPGTFARQFRESNLNLGLSPDKRGVPTPGFSRGKNMTLKEQSSTIDRLSKENFDLKMRIHFLNEALNKRSEEGVKEMISENVELKSDKLKLQKDNQSLRKKIRELEKQLRDHGEGEKGDVKDEGASGSEEERATMEEEELIYLQERLETYEIEIERLRSESIARETEKRRLAEMVKSLSDGRVVGSEAGAREERDMWKDMLDAEPAAREQAEEENRHLREEILQMRGGDAVSTTHSRSTRRRGMSSRMEAELRNQQENLRALQAEMRSANEGILRLEEDAQNNLQKYKAVQQELEDANRELEALEKNLFESNSKIQRLTVQLESSQNEIAFLREEQDADKIKIGDLESDLKTTQINLQSERDQTRELDCRLAEERHQREVVGGKEKQEVQRIMNELNRENTGAKDEIRKLKKALSAREIEANTWKERLFELESSLREALGDLNGTRSSLLLSITKLQKELESTTLELQSARETLDEKEALLRNRDALLESHGLETRKLSELLERERQAHRADKHSFEQALKSHHQASRTIAQSNTRISDLEHARGQDRKRFSTLEQQYKDQLNERNAMFLAIWKRLSVMCGPDWAHSNSLINGNLPSQEVIGNMLFWPGFSKNLLLALKTVEHLVNGFKGRVKNVERDLTKAYQNLEHTLNIRLKKLDRLEELAHQLRVQKRPLSSNSTNAEISKLRGENRLLKAELNLLQSHSRSRGSTAAAAAAHANPRSDRSSSVVSRAPSGIPQPAHHHSSSTALAKNSFGPVAGATPPQPKTHAI
ncbi:hypothetical protein CISG_08106 [Coccidioides immitis RMSCC 3703]|uniref:Anucleate primary sterigmata protein B n=1 Tax=Coccidioides immitis RMSCC 3703 TaxID=454286 RepID=A0A0J8R4X1_COCIT|nr:hypothetical protein CISG_08106 [Coccidioides immitis RMSCC 3703]